MFTSASSAPIGGGAAATPRLTCGPSALDRLISQPRRWRLRLSGPSRGRAACLYPLGGPHEVQDAGHSGEASWDWLAVPYEPPLQRADADPQVRVVWVGSLTGSDSARRATLPSLSDHTARPTPSQGVTSYICYTHAGNGCRGAPEGRETSAPRLPRPSTCSSASPPVACPRPWVHV